jgi:CRISPR system Cascade subunit CasD
MRVVLMRLDAPLMAFGREMVDATGPTRGDPDVSLLTGLFANALGWRREEAERHQALQDRLLHAARIDREGAALIDFQTAQLARTDKSWTTRGVPEGRAGSAETYKSPHLRYRHYCADACLTLAVTLRNPDAPPSLDELAAALDEPARPLFIGRKPCLPAGPLKIAVIESASLVAALDSVPAEGARLHVLPFAEAAAISDGYRREESRTTRRDWLAGVHAGQETRVLIVREGRCQETAP